MKTIKAAIFLKIYEDRADKDLTKKISIDHLIVGQGLAGSLLAWELLLRGRKVMIIDNGAINASRIAAGLVNPVTGLRFVKSENIDTLLPNAKDCYAQLSDYFKRPFYIEKPLLRLFRNEQERNRCLERLTDPRYHSFLGDVQDSGEMNIHSMVMPFGCLEQKETGYLLTQSLLTSLKNFFIAKSAYRQEHFDYRDVQFQPQLGWRELRPSQIVFCEGHLASNNPWFSCLPMQPVQGEILTFEHSLQLPDKIIHYGHWLIPLSSSRIRIGATFDRNHLDPVITERGKSELIHSSKQVIPKIDQATLIEQQAGIRPSTQDRRPFIGSHPKYPPLFIFNGFGAKGSVSIPWYCRQFADFLLRGTPLPGHCNIRRYYETHFTA